MRFRSKSVLLALVAVFAMSAGATAAASASTPEFKPVPAKKKFTSTSGEMSFKMAVDSIYCKADTAAGEVTGARTVGHLIEKLTGCKSSSATKSGCEIRSVGAKNPGEILMAALEGELGTATGAASGVAMLLQPEVGKTWTTVETNECTIESAITGKVAAEVPTIGKKQLTNSLVLALKEGKQAITKITLDSGEVVKVALTMFTEPVNVTETGALKFEEALEVT